MKKITFILFLSFLSSFVVAQKLPKAGPLNKFLKTNRGVSLFFHGPNQVIITEDDIQSWDWETYTIVLKKKSWKKLKGLKFPSFDKKAKDPQKAVVAFSICFNSKEISPVLAIKDTVPFGIEFPYFEVSKVKKDRSKLVLSPNSANFEAKMSECEEAQKALIELAKDDPYERLVVMALFRRGDQLCKDVLIPYLMLYDRDLMLYLEHRDLLKKEVKKD